MPWPWLWGLTEPAAHHSLPCMKAQPGLSGFLVLVDLVQAVSVKPDLLINQLYGYQISGDVGNIEKAL